MKVFIADDSEIVRERLKAMLSEIQDDSLQEICAQFKMNKYSSVSSVIERMKARIDTNRQIKKRINGLCGTIKSQEQT
jgi:5-methylcytosine-specific restriction endonuclease McrBC regulatory subunit McrC